MSKKPHILIILSDEHRWDCLGTNGNKDIKTPHIDSLAKDGVNFSNTFCTFPICTPSRYSFLTGMYVHQHMGWSNHSSIPSQLPTFPKLLKKSGYKTKAVGKMHFTPTYLEVGFDEMILSEQNGPGRYDDDYHRYLMEKGLVDATDLIDQVGFYRSKAPDEYHQNHGSTPTNLPKEEYVTSWVGNRAIESIEKWDDSSPQLLMVGFVKPHHPFDVPEPWASMYVPQTLELLPGWTENVPKRDKKFNRGFIPHDNLDEEKMRLVMSKYYGSISMIDDQVGKMIDILKKKGQYDNTIIIYTSDHGDYMGYHHMCFKGNYMYDAVMKIPLIVKYPNSENASIESKELVSNTDLTSFILEQAESIIPQNMWNSSIPLDPEEGRKYVFGEQGSLISEPAYMIRSKTRKLLFSKSKPSLFFNLEEDPFELKDLFKDPQYTEEIDAYKNRLFKWLAFEATTPEYLDERSPIIKGNNVPTLDDGHRKIMKNYFKKKMDELGYN